MGGLKLATCHQHVRSYQHVTNFISKLVTCGDPAGTDLAPAPAAPGSGPSLFWPLSRPSLQKMARAIFSQEGTNLEIARFLQTSRRPF